MDDEAIPDHQARGNFAARFFLQLDQYKKLFLKYWWLLLLAVCLSEGIQMLMLKRTPLNYVSVGRMIVSVKLSIPNASVYSEDYNNFFGTQVELMKSDSVINRVNLRLKTARPNLKQFPVSIAATLSSKASIFNLRAEGGDADYTQAYLQATMEEYINLKKELLAAASSTTQSRMEEELKQMGVKLQNSKQEMDDYQSSNSVTLLEPMGNVAAEYLSSLTRKLAEQRSELQLQKRLSLDQNLERLLGTFGQKNTASQSNTFSVSIQTNPANAPVNNDTPQNNIPSNLGGFEDAYLQAKQQIILLNVKSNELSKFPALYATAIRLNNQEIDRQVILLEIYKAHSEEQLRNRQHALELQIQVLESQVAEWESKALEVSKKLAVFKTLKENHNRLQIIYDQLQANLQTLDMNKGFGQESVSILEPASWGVPVPPETRKHLIMAGLIGLFLGVGILVLINQLDDRPSSVTELEQLFDLPILGQIPSLKPKSKDAEVSILQPNDDRYPLIEANRNLRSALLFKDSFKNPLSNELKSIVISSPSPNDGKSMTAANFAITLAQANSRVLLIDADLRRGVLHNHFSTAVSPGLAEVLAERCAWSTAVVKTPIPNLDLIPCGTVSPHSGNLFAKVDKLLSEIAGRYDYYVFDTAPVMVADDVLTLSPQMDGLIMVIRAGFTSKRVAEAALDSLHLRQVNVMGLVFNGVDPKANDYYYYRHKEYYPVTPS